MTNRTVNSENLEFRLKKCINDHALLIEILKYIHNVEPQAYICAGVIRNWIWSVLHGQEYQFDGTEIDVIFYDLSDTKHNKTQILFSDLSCKYPEIQWDVTNQATVHEWYKTENGQAILPLKSIAEAVSYWPETATAIAVRIDENQHLEVIAPLGLSDLFELKLRWNDRLVSRGVFEQRVHSKKFLERWPKLEIVH